jgi:hypothetical protein
MQKHPNHFLARMAWLVAALVATWVWWSVAIRTTTPAPSVPPGALASPAEELLLDMTLERRRVRLVRTAADFRIWADIDEQRWTSDTVIPFTTMPAAEHIAEVRLDSDNPPAWAEIETTIARPGDTPTIFRIPREAIDHVVQRLGDTDEDQVTLPIPMTLLQGGPQTWVWYYSKRGLSSANQITHDVRFLRRRP